MAALRALWRVLYLSRRHGSGGLRAHLAVVPRMLALGLTGRYPYLRKGRLLLAALAVLYVFSPLNLIPELVAPLIGLGDDAVMLTWALGTLLAETETFLSWERERGRVVVGEVVG